MTLVPTGTIPAHSQTPASFLSLHRLLSESHQPSSSKAFIGNSPCGEQPFEGINSPINSLAGEQPEVIESTTNSPGNAIFRISPSLDAAVDCDQPICWLHTRQLGFYLISRGYGGVGDVCPDCEAAKNHW
ncbi:MAG: hypothetical protein ACRCU2_21450, partial [Planktothrix sp.]